MAHDRPEPEGEQGQIEYLGQAEPAHGQTILMNTCQVRRERYEDR